LVRPTQPAPSPHRHARPLRLLICPVLCSLPRLPVRSLIDLVGANKGALPLQAEICLDAITWAEQSKRTFLKQRIQTRLASVYVAMRQYNQAISLITRLTREVKKFDDKLLLVEIFLIESRAHLQLENLPKSKGALTAARSSANAIYCPPQLQAEIDMQAGILCAAEKDFKTAYSYFYEAFEGYNTIKDSAQAVKAIKYMLLGKVTRHLTPRHATSSTRCSLQTIRVEQLAYPRRCVPCYAPLCRS
jgi:26S proteasome regulatory subunit N6